MCFASLCVCLNNDQTFLGSKLESFSSWTVFPSIQWNNINLDNNTNNMQLLSEIQLSIQLTRKQLYSPELGSTEKYGCPSTMLQTSFALFPYTGSSASVAVTLVTGVPVVQKNRVMNFQLHKQSCLHCCKPYGRSAEPIRMKPFNPTWG